MILPDLFLLLILPFLPPSRLLLGDLKRKSSLRLELMNWSEQIRNISYIYENMTSEELCGEILGDPLISIHACMNIYYNLCMHVCVMCCCRASCAP